MVQESFGRRYGGAAPENYERHFVPAIGAPLARDLLDKAELSVGESVLDVACGTGVVTRLAVEDVGPGAVVAGLDVNAGMLRVARANTPPGVAIDWYETSAEAMPLPDDAFDVVLCQMGLQFIPNKLAALREMRRVLSPSGRALVSVPGPTPAMMTIVANALARHVDRKVAQFVHVVFSLHEEDELRRLMTSAGFRQVRVVVEERALAVPPPAQFLWGYLNSTPLGSALAAAAPEQREATERDVVAAWQDCLVDGELLLEVRMSTVEAAS